MVSTLIRKPNTVARSPKKWTRKRQRFYAHLDQHGRRVSSEELMNNSPEKSSVAYSSEIKEDGLRFLERQLGSSTP